MVLDSNMFDGHFVCSTGDVSTETILEYIKLDV